MTTPGRKKPVPGQKRKDDAVLMERRMKALCMKQEGMSYRAIAAELGISFSQARNDVNYMVDEYQMPAVNEYRRSVIADVESQLARLYKLRAKPQYVTNQKGYVLGPDGQPIVDHEWVLKVEDRIMKLRDQLTKLIGANAPQQSEITVTEVGPTDLAIADLVTQQKARDALKRQEFEASVRAQNESPAQGD